MQEKVEVGIDVSRKSNKLVYRSFLNTSSNTTLMIHDFKLRSVYFRVAMFGVVLKDTNLVFSRADEGHVTGMKNVYSNANLDNLYLGLNHGKYYVKCLAS